MALADDLSDDIAAVLDDDDFGSDGTLTKLASSSYSDATGKATQTPTPYTVRLMLLGIRDSNVNGTTILLGDRRAIIKAKNLAVAPAVGDRLTVQGETMTIVDVKPGTIGAAGTRFMYSCTVRKGGTSP